MDPIYIVRLPRHKNLAFYASTSMVMTRLPLQPILMLDRSFRMWPGYILHLVDMHLIWTNQHPYNPLYQLSSPHGLPFSSHPTIGPSDFGFWVSSSSQGAFSMTKTGWWLTLGMPGRFFGLRGLGESLHQFFDAGLDDWYGHIRFQSNSIWFDLNWCDNQFLMRSHMKHLKHMFHKFPLHSTFAICL